MDLPHPFIFLKFFGENSISNQSAKADVQFSSLNGCFVPKADSQMFSVSGG
jgi:hypothetical protein